MDSNEYHNVTRKDQDIIIMPKSGRYTETLIFLHGLGDTADGGWMNLFVDKSSSPCLPTTRVVLLQAPIAQVTLNQGAKMPSWYDIKSFKVNQSNAEETLGYDEIIKNAERITKAVKEEISLLRGDSRRVMIGGFSQGCAMALHVGLEFDKPLGAIIGWSGYLFPRTKLNEANDYTPIFLSHGTDDPMVPCNLSEETYERLDKKKHKLVKMKEEGLGHGINENVVHETGKFIRRFMSLHMSKL